MSIATTKAFPRVSRETALSCTQRGFAPKELRVVRSTMNTLGTLERGLKILDLLVEIESDPVRRAKGVSVKHVATTLDIHKSSASRLIQILVSTGYAVPANPNRRGFRLGPAVQTREHLHDAQRRLSIKARPYLERLVDVTGECSHAAISAGTSALVIDDAETGKPLRVVAGSGRRVPLHCTSAGKVLLAHGLATLPVDLGARTNQTITDVEALKSELAAIVDQGYALDDEENDDGVRCISAPVRQGRAGPVIGCIGIDGPSIRVTPESVRQLAALVVQAASDLSTELEERSTASADVS